MTKKLMFLIVFILMILGLVCFLMGINYLLPEMGEFAISVVAISFLIFFTSILSFIIYFVKKVYNRGDVNVNNFVASIRQAFFVGIYIILLIVFYKYSSLNYITIILLANVLFMTELFIKNTAK